MAPANSANKKAANSLVALSSAAVLAVYTAGYLRTKSAADRFAVQAAARHPPSPLSTARPAAVGPTRTPDVAPQLSTAPPHANRTTNRPARRQSDRTVQGTPERSKRPVVSTTNNSATEGT